MNSMKHRGLARFGLERGWIGDVSNLAYSKCEGVGNFFGKWGGFGFGGVYWCICDVGGMSQVMSWPNTDTNSFLVTCGDLKFGVSDKGVEGVIPLDEEPQVVDKLEG
jgi:hypothetical protein